jgi:hypothetical protein
MSMPEGISTEVEDGYVIISFHDPSKRGPVLTTLLEAGSPIDVDTSGLRKRYRVPEGNARAAGLIDEVRPARKTTPPAKKTAPIKETVPPVVPKVSVPAAPAKKAPATKKTPAVKRTSSKASSAQSPPTTDVV